MDLHKLKHTDRIILEISLRSLSIPNESTWTKTHRLWGPLYRFRLLSGEHEGLN